MHKEKVKHTAWALCPYEECVVLNKPFRHICPSVLEIVLMKIESH